MTRIAATSNRKSLATAIATQKNHCDSENTCKTAISLRFLREKLATSKNLTIHAPPPEKNDEHRQCHSGGGIYVAVLLGSDHLYTTP